MGVGLVSEIFCICLGSWAGGGGLLGAGPRPVDVIG
jgi:hypothetical protein